jgi:IPT/TIG domain
MKRTIAFATLIGALAVGVALVSSSASAVTSAAPQTPSHIKGVVPVIGKQFPGAGNPLVYHGGPVMTTNKTYAIYWKPSGYSIASGYDTTINQFFTDVAADNGKSTNVYAVDTQYSSIQYSSAFGGSFTDTNAFPVSGCPLYGGLSECLTDAQIQAEINNVIATEGWTKNGTNMFFMFTPQNVGSCFDSSGSECAYTAYCAYHGTASSSAIYANQPYAAHAGCDEGQYPNGSSTQADPTINVVSHEHNEAITDPRLNAWYDAQGNEIGDKCAWIFGALSGPNGSEYNQTINGHHYFLQEEWSNAGSTCLQSYGGGGGGNPPQISSFTPTRGRHGTLVTIFGKNFTGTTAVAFVRGLTNYSASYSVLSSTQIRATVPNAGVGYGKWKATTPGGSATSTSLFYVTG